MTTLGRLEVRTVSFIKWMDAPAAALVWQHIEREDQHTACGLPTPAGNDDVYRIRRPDASILKLCRRCRKAELSP